MKMNLEDYRGKMGRLIDAGALLKAIDGSGRQMRIPNIYIALGATATLNLDDYVADSDAIDTAVGNSAIATASLNANTLIVEALSTGQTSLTIEFEDGSQHHTTITVRDGANDNGWL